MNIYSTPDLEVLEETNFSRPVSVAAGNCLRQAIIKANRQRLRYVTGRAVMTQVFKEQTVDSFLREAGCDFYALNEKIGHDYNSRRVYYDDPVEFEGIEQLFWKAHHLITDQQVTGPITPVDVCVAGLSYFTNGVVTLDFEAAKKFRMPGNKMRVVAIGRRQK